MDKTSGISIMKVTTPEYKKVIIETNTGQRFYADLSSMQGVYCFPKDFQAWSQVSVDSYGLDLVWPSRFEVHVDQVMHMIYKTESLLLPHSSVQP